jgi:hypothetical protein
MHGRIAGLAGVLLLASSPFAIYYSSEARMYSLVVLLVLCGVLVLPDYLRRPHAARGLLLAVLTAGLALTHYWALFLLAVVAGALAGSGWRAGDRTRLRAVGWMAVGGLLFLPWLPTFLFQLVHTGTPWGTPAGYSALASTLSAWSGDSGTAAGLLALVLLLLAVGGAFVTAASGTRIHLDLRGRGPGGPLVLAVVGTLVLALTVGQVTGSVYAPRYTSVVLPLFLLAAAVGVARLPARARAPVLAIAVAAGLAGAIPHAVYGWKTQAPVIATALRGQAHPGDVVVYCPDQLGPSTSRLLPASLRLDQQEYPSGGPPDLVDWVDYATRNEAADPVSYAKNLSRHDADRTVWLVSSGGYRTFGNQCQLLAQELTDERGRPAVLVESDPGFFEHAQLLSWAPAPVRPR